MMDEEAIYTIGFYKKGLVSSVDLILVSKHEPFAPILKKVLMKTFNTKYGVDFGGAAGLQVVKDGVLHIWGIQKEVKGQIAVNRFSQQ